MSRTINLVSIGVTLILAGCSTAGGSLESEGVYAPPGVVSLTNGIYQVKKYNAETGELTLDMHIEAEQYDRDSTVAVQAQIQALEAGLAALRALVAPVPVGP
jgi:hypothetical protein